MIGYNAEEINNLIGTLNSSYKTLGETMANGWDTVSSTLGTEWVGPDEVSFETELAKRMCTLYDSCFKSVENMIKNVITLGQAWQDFQNANLLEGAEIKAVGFDLTKVSLEKADLAKTVKAPEREFTKSTRMGVTNGTASAQKINKAVTTYVNTIGEKVKKMYDLTSTASAFLGSSESSTLEEYLKKMSASFADVVTQVEDMQIALEKLVKAYDENMKANIKAIKQADTSVSQQSTTTTQS